MYLRSILLENTGPIERLTVEMPFNSEHPVPLLLVGPNGSGKTTVLSFIANALLAFKQGALDASEVEKGQVYRMRSPLGIHGGTSYFHSHLSFEHGLEVHEWQLDQTRETFEKAHGPLLPHTAWNRIPPHETSAFDLQFGTLHAAHQIQEVLGNNCLLFFPSDRFEPPDWLNSEGLSSELKLPEPTRVKGRTQRRILARNRLKPTLEWWMSVAFDVLANKHREANLSVQDAGQGGPAQIAARVPVLGPSGAVFRSIGAILREVLAEDVSDQIQVGIGSRHTRVASANILRNGNSVRAIKDLTSLSAGESGLFCLFAGIILDADQAGMKFDGPNDIRGLVLIDEADLHLHLGFQYRVLPRLLALFPKVQFVMTAHSPLVALGMEVAGGNNGVVVRELPSGTEIAPESYSDFVKAFEAFTKTKTFKSQVLARIDAQSNPVILVEGKGDEILIRNAWAKLRPNPVMPWEVIPCGVEPTPEDRSGGAEVLRRCLEFSAIVSHKRIIAVFDNDRKGNEQFAGINKKAFVQGADSSHKKHTAKRAHAILLPVPPGREKFVTTGDINQRYLSIEHYFSDTILNANDMAGPSILGTGVFEIAGDKVSFAEKTENFDANEFAAFGALFDRIETLLSSQPVITAHT